jgi:hypothetical protein
MCTDKQRDFIISGAGSGIAYFFNNFSTETKQYLIYEKRNLSNKLVALFHLHVAKEEV